MAEKHKFAKDYSILTGSFSNLDMAQNMISAQNPDHQSSEEDFERSHQIVLDARDPQEDQPLHRRHRRCGVVNGRTNS